jgi:hypothetical protein
MAENRTIAIEVDVESGDALKRLDKLEAAMFRTQEEAAEMAEKMEKGFEAAGKGADGAAKGVDSVGSSVGGLLKSLGLIAIAMEVFNFLKEILMKNQVVMDAMNTATLAFEILLKSLFEKVSSLVEPMKSVFEDPKQAIIDLGNLILENIINRFKGAVLAAEAVGTTFTALFRADWDGAADGVKDYASALIQVGTGLDKEQQDNFVDGVKELVAETAEATKGAIDEAAAMVTLRNELQLLEAEQRKQILVSQNLAELERQKRDDISLTIAERISANDELGRILNEQSEIETGIANKRLDLAQRELALDKNNIDLQVAVINAETELADVRERINGQRSEQLTNQVALEKELFDFQQELRLLGKTERQIEMEELIIEVERLAEIKRLATDTEIDIEAEKRDRIAALTAEWDAEDTAAAQKHADDLQKIEDKKAADVQAAEDKKQAYREAGLSAASSVVSNLGQLAGVLAKQGDESVALQKTLAIAQVAIDTARAISAGVAGATTSATATGPGAFVATPIFIATTIATILGSLAQVGTILAGVPGPSAGGAVSGASANIPAASSPNISAAATSSTEIGNAQGAQLAPIQAFVVETEMTGNQQNISQIENQVTFGIDG